MADEKGLLLSPQSSFLLQRTPKLIFYGEDRIADQNDTGVRRRNNNIEELDRQVYLFTKVVLSNIMLNFLVIF